MSQNDFTMTKIILEENIGDLLTKDEYSAACLALTRHKQVPHLVIALKNAKEDIKRLQDTLHHKRYSNKILSEFIELYDDKT